MSTAFPVNPFIYERGAEVVAAAQVRYAWYHTACDTKIIAFKAVPDGRKPVWGGYCPHCKKAVDLPDEDVG